MTGDFWTVGAVLRSSSLRKWRRDNQPTLKELMEWEAEGGCQAAAPCGCWVEPDGKCPHGYASWLRVLGYV